MSHCMHCIHCFNCSFCTFLCAKLCAHFYSTIGQPSEEFSATRLSVTACPNIYLCFIYRALETLRQRAHVQNAPRKTLSNLCGPRLFRLRLAAPFPCQRLLRV